MYLSKIVKISLSGCFVAAFLSAQVNAGWFSCLKSSSEDGEEAQDHSLRFSSKVCRVAEDPLAIKSLYPSLNFSKPMALITLDSSGLHENCAYTWVCLVPKGRLQHLGRDLSLGNQELKQMLATHKFLLIVLGGMKLEREEITVLPATGDLLVNGRVPSSWSAETKTSKSLFPLYRIFKGDFSTEMKDVRSMPATSNILNLAEGNVRDTIEALRFLHG